MLVTVTVVLVGGCVRRMSGSEWGELRRVKDVMVLDAPAAFDPGKSPTTAWSAAQWVRWCGRLAESEVEAGWCIGPPSAWEALIVAAAVSEPSGFSVGWGWLWVVPQQRNRRLATALIDEVHTWALGRDVDRCFLWVAEHNYQARSLYYRLGYRPTGLWTPTTRPDRGEERWEIRLRLR